MSLHDVCADYNPIQNGMPRNCSADLSRIIEHVDKVIDDGNSTVVRELQTMFGMQDLNHTDDFAK